MKSGSLSVVEWRANNLQYLPVLVFVEVEVEIYLKYSRDTYYLYISNHITLHSHTQIHHIILQRYESYIIINYSLHFILLLSFPFPSAPATRALIFSTQDQ